MEARIPRFALITQNVDDLHRRAGSRNIIALHGDIQRTKCFDCLAVVAKWEESTEPPPRCPACDGLLRPDVVWFGEALPAEALGAAFEAASRCQVFFSIGTSTLVEPAASLPFVALEHNIPVVEINPARTPLTDAATYVLQSPAGKVLPELVTATWNAKSSGNQQGHG